MATAGRGLSVAVIGGGPAGLAAAEQMSAAGLACTVYDSMPSVGRKFLMAGRGGLNLTHTEPLADFINRYGVRAAALSPAIVALPPSALSTWAEGLGQSTFVGSSGRVFPSAMKASPLLRAWLSRLAAQGVKVLTRCKWEGWNAKGDLRFIDQGVETTVARPKATVLALGGASWPRLGSDGAWMDTLAAASVQMQPLRPANAGVQIAWSELFRARFAGTPLKPVSVSFDGRRVRGEAVVTARGLEGGAVYTLFAALREAVAAPGSTALTVDLAPDQASDSLTARLAKGTRPGASTATVLRKAGLSPVAVNLAREAGPLPPVSDSAALARRLKAVPLTVVGVDGLARAISTAGGVDFAALADDFSLRSMPDVFVAGEMLDWEAPTGGYLLQACFATGVAAAEGVLARLRSGVGAQVCEESGFGAASVLGAGAAVD